MPHSTLSRQLAAMEREGLLTRERHALDGRAVAVRLTAQGRARYREWLPLALAEAEAVLGLLTPADRAAFGRVLRLLEHATSHDQPSASIA